MVLNDNTNEKKRTIKMANGYLLSVILPAIILMLSYFLNGVYPGSEKSILIFDMGAQYASFYSYLHQLGDGFNTLMYQTVSALGGGFYGTWAYYISDPLSFIVLLFGRSGLPLALYILTVLKISLCGLSFSVYIKKGRLRCNDDVLIILSSTAYALMTYNVFYSMNLMWIDGVMLLPIVILGVDLICDKKSVLPFIISLAAAVVLNYYTAYMIILFVVLYYLFLAIYKRMPVASFVKNGMIFLCSGILSGLISAFVWLPVLIDIGSGKLSEETKSMVGFIRNPIAVLRQLLPFSYDSFFSKGAPPAYCGIIITLSLVLYFFSKRISTRQKVAVALVYAVYMISLCWDRTDVIWHVMQIPNFFPARYIFTLSFFMICIFVECVSANKELILGFSKRKMISIAALLVFIIDISVNCFYTIRTLDSDPITGGYINNIYFEHHLNSTGLLKTAVEDDRFRIVSDADFSSNDGLLYGIPSLDYFSSSYNLGLSDLLRGMGLNVNHNDINDLGLCPVSASLLGVDYYVEYYNGLSSNSLTQYFSEYENAYGLGIYENPYSFPDAYIINEHDDADFTYNVFDNLNRYFFDVTGTDNIFIECANESVSSYLSNEDVIRTEFTVYPSAGMHLYFYVSPEDYYRILDGTCYDSLYLGGNCLASYVNVGNRYIVDLGYSDGTPLDFTFDSKSESSHVWFYSFDQDLYCKTMNTFTFDYLSDASYDSKGINYSFDMSNDSEVLLLLPYEDGYYVTLDGSPAKYYDYKDALVKLRIPEGSHFVRIKYFTPGLKTGFALTVFGLILLVFYALFLSPKKNRSII